MNDLEKIIGYTFADSSLLRLALTHSSYISSPDSSQYCNERLEFLGDSVLSVIVARYLYENLPGFGEGRLTRLRASLVCEETLAKNAEQIGLGQYLLVNKGGELDGTRQRKSVLSDAFEAIIAAIYLDSGLEQAARFVERFLPGRDVLEKDGGLCVTGDYKTALQEVVQQDSQFRIEYRLTDESGAAHDKVFVTEATVSYLGRNICASGEGKSKKEAEQQAAKEALRLISHEEQEKHEQE